MVLLVSLVPKESSDSQIGLAYGLVQIGLSSEFFFPSNYFQIGQHIVLLRTLIIKVIIMNTEITIIIMSISSV